MNHSTRLRRPLALAVAATLSLAALTACSDSPGTDSQSNAGDGRIGLVASTSVWASVAEAVGGEDIAITTIITDPAADPHSFDASAADTAKIKDADIVLANGGGYDAFINQALTDSPGIPLVEAIELAEPEAASGHAEGQSAGPSSSAAATEPSAAPATEAAPADGNHAADHEHAHGNEHVWYDFHVVREVAAEVAKQLGELAPAKAAIFTDRATSFENSVKALEEEVTAWDTPRNLTYVQTEPVGEYLLELAGLKDGAPAGYIQALNSETEPAAADLSATLDLLERHQVGLFVLNSQTEDPQSRQLTAAAEQGSVPQWVITETLPAGTSYLSWMTTNVDNLSSAIGV